VYEHAKSQNSTPTVRPPRAQPTPRLVKQGPVPLPTVGPGASTVAELAPDDPFHTWPWVDRRHIPDRRRNPTRWWDSMLGRKRRVRGRRTGEITNVYVDVYYNADLLLVLVVFILNLLDAALTLDHLGRGGSESNPAMAQILTFGPYAFVLEKGLAVGLCLVALTVHKTFRLARVGTYCLLTAYGALTAYHALLQLQY
jgi:hypothetical protein